MSSYLGAGEVGRDATEMEAHHVGAFAEIYRMMSQSQNGLLLPFGDMGLPAIQKFASTQLQNAKRAYELLVSEAFRDSLLSAGSGTLVLRQIRLFMQLYTNLVNHVHTLTHGALDSPPSLDNALSQLGALTSAPTSTSSSTSLVPLMSASSPLAALQTSLTSSVSRGLLTTGVLSQASAPSLLALPPSSVPTKAVSIAYLVQVEGQAAKKVRANITSCFCYFVRFKDVYPFVGRDIYLSRLSGI